MICSHKRFAIVSFIIGLLLLTIIIVICTLIYWNVVDIHYIGGPEGPQGPQGPQGAGGGPTSTFLSVSRDMFI